MTCTNLTSDNITEYCGTWYGTNHNGFKATFANLANGSFSYDGFDNHETKGSSTPMEWTLCWLWDTMAEITHKCKESANVQLCDYATSHLQIVASKIWNLRVTYARESMHPLTWSLVEWKMAWAIQLVDWNIGMKLCWNRQILIVRGLESKGVL